MLNRSQKFYLHGLRVNQHQGRPQHRTGGQASH